MPTDEVTWPLPPHTQAKHDILRRYLNAWFPIMADYASSFGGRRLVYIDGFAGPGEHDHGEEGSPLIVLNTLLQHARWSKGLSGINYTFLFIEINAKRAEHLERVLSTIDIPANITWQVTQGAFESVLTEKLDSLQKIGGTLAPAFISIDPFGPEGFSMSLVQRILSYRASEVLITLNLRDLARWYLPVAERHAQVDKLFGCQDWRKCISTTDAQKTEDCLRSVYRAQVASGSNLFVRDFRMENKHNQTSYYLIYVTHHRKGRSVMKQAMWGVDPSGGFQYSDVTNPHQHFLFGPQYDEMDAQSYANELSEHYKGKTVSKEELQRRTEEHEHYLGRHLTKALDSLTTTGGATPSAAKRGRGWPAETTFRFAG